MLQRLTSHLPMTKACSGARAYKVEAGMAFLQLEGLSKRYGSINAVVATDLNVDRVNSFRCWARPVAAKPPPCR